MMRKYMRYDSSNGYKRIQLFLVKKYRYTFLDFNFKHSFNYTQLYKGTHCTRVQEFLVHLS